VKFIQVYIGLYGAIAQGGQILVSRSVYDVTEHIFKFKQFGTVPVKGRKKAVEIFEVLY